MNPNNDPVIAAIAALLRVRRTNPALAAALTEALNELDSAIAEHIDEGGESINGVVGANRELRQSR